MKCHWSASTTGFSPCEMMMVGRGRSPLRCSSAAAEIIGLCQSCVWTAAAAYSGIPVSWLWFQTNSIWGNWERLWNKLNVYRVINELDWEDSWDNSRGSRTLAAHWVHCTQHCGGFVKQPVDVWCRATTIYRSEGHFVPRWFNFSLWPVWTCGIKTFCTVCKRCTACGVFMTMVSAL